SRIFEAWSDEPWVNEGAAVRVSLVCFGESTQGAKLDGATVGTITSSLVELIHHDVAKATTLTENVGRGFQGVTPRAEIQKKRRIALGLPDASFNLTGNQ